MYDKTQTFNANIAYNLSFGKFFQPTALAVGFPLSVKITKIIKERNINAVFFFSSKYAIDMARNYAD